MKPLLLLAAALFWAPASAAEDPAHNELRAVRDAVVAAVNAGDVEGIAKHLHAKAVFTAMNAETAVGPEGVRAYFAKMMTGPSRVVESINVSVEVDDLSALHGGSTAVAAGGANGRYSLRAGPTFSINQRWTATLVKEGGRWQVAALHASANVFDNPLLAAAKKSALWAAGAAFVAGAAAAALVARGMCKTA